MGEWPGGRLAPRISDVSTLDARRIRDSEHKPPWNKEARDSARQNDETQTRRGRTITATESPLIRERSFLVLPEHHGWRLDRFLGAMIPRLSRNRVQQVIARGVSLEDGRLPKPGRPVHAGERVLVRQIIEPTSIEPYQGPLPILYEDEEIVAINKPAPLACHPSARYLSGTITDRTGLRLAHRLDRETSGVLLLAKSEAAERWLKDAFRDRAAKKRYLAWVEGAVSQDQFQVELPVRLAPHARVRLRMETHPAGLPAKTSFRVLERYKEKTFLEIFPETGRQHQIRVHLAAIGHPILGDKLYQMGEDFFLRYCDGLLSEEEQARYVWPRMLLHAESLSLTRPDGSRLTLHAPLPAELKAGNGP